MVLLRYASVVATAYALIAWNAYASVSTTSLGRTHGPPPMLHLIDITEQLHESDPR